MKSLAVPDRVGVDVGWRGWQVKQHGTVVVLCSANGTTWPLRQELEADCSKAHDAPAPRCRCGIYAARSLEHLRELGYQDLGVIGQVALWGEVVVGELGFRAQYAYPMKLYVPYESWQLAWPLADAYGVAARLLNPYCGEVTEDGDR